LKNLFSEGNRDTIYLGKFGCKIKNEEFKRIKRFIKVYFLGAKVKSSEILMKDSEDLGEFDSTFYECKLYDSVKILK